MKTIVRRVRIALYLHKLSRSEKVNMGKATYKAMTENTGFFPPSESAALLAVLQTTTVNLSKADAATVSGSHQSFADANGATFQFDNAMRNVGNYVQSKADELPARAEEIIRAAALPIRKEKVKTQPTVPIRSVRAIVTGMGNSIKLLIESDNPYGTHYEILMTSTPDIESSWISIANITARKHLVKNLENGVKYYFKARATNRIGKSIFTEVVWQIAA